jgi:hypothetical protein
MFLKNSYSSLILESCTQLSYKSFPTQDLKRLPPSIHQSIDPSEDKITEPIVPRAPNVDHVFCCHPWQETLATTTQCLLRPCQGVWNWTNTAYNNRTEIFVLFFQIPNLLSFMLSPDLGTVHLPSAELNDTNLNLKIYKKETKKGGGKTMKSNVENHNKIQNTSTMSGINIDSIQTACGHWVLHLRSVHLYTFVLTHLYPFLTLSYSFILQAIYPTSLTLATFRYNIIYYQPDTVTQSS